MSVKKSKDKKTIEGLRKFNLDLFGILTFTRYHGGPFEEFMYSEKNKKGPPQVAGKGKKKPPVNVPVLPKFPEVPEPTFQAANWRRQIEKLKEQNEEKKKELFLTIHSQLKSIARRPSSKRKTIISHELGTLRSVKCGDPYPFPPRPQPHGGIYGDRNCPQCNEAGGLTDTLWEKIHKKLRKSLTKEFNKAKFIIEYLIEQMNDSITHYEKTTEEVFNKINSELESMSKATEDEYHDMKTLRSAILDKKEELHNMNAQFFQYKYNKEDYFKDPIQAKLDEIAEKEEILDKLELKVKDKLELLEFWTENRDKGLLIPLAKVEEAMERLRQIREGITYERNYLAKVLRNELKFAWENAVKAMEKYISGEVDQILATMHPAWFRVMAENQSYNREWKLQSQFSMFEIEIAGLAQQIRDLKKEKRETQAMRTQGYRLSPTSTDNEKSLKCEKPYVIPLHKNPPTDFLHL